MPKDNAEGAEGKLLVRIEYYADPNPRNPQGYKKFTKRARALHRGEVSKWAAVVADSITSMELAARKQQQYVLNKGSRDPRQWYAGSTDQIEEQVAMRLSGLPMTVGVAAHVSRDKDEVHGNMLSGVSAPGRMSHRLPAFFGEFYHLMLKREEDGEVKRVLQTQSDDYFNANTMIGAPDLCAPTYKALWAKWEGEKEIIHCLVYGDSGAGKSTFLATFPKPLLVMLFDPSDKGMPYLRKGTPGPMQVDEWGTPFRLIYKKAA